MNSRFEQTNGRAILFTLQQIHLFGGCNAVISSNIHLRRDGLPYANQRALDDPGIAVYFTYKARQMWFACDKWPDVYDNIYANGKTIEALRGIERWGTGDMVEQAFTGLVALEAPKDPYRILSLTPGPSEEEIDAAYRQKAMAAHPDRGGSASAMAELTEARPRLKERAA